jgi:hypothetical protein
VITCPAVVGHGGCVKARAGTRDVSCFCAQATAVPTRRRRRRRRGRVGGRGGRQWRSRRAVVMSLGKQRFSSRIRWLSGAPLSPSSSSGVGKGSSAAVYQKPRVLFGFVGREYETRVVMTARLLVGKRLTSRRHGGVNTQHSSHKGSMESGLLPCISSYHAAFDCLLDHIPISYLC